MLVAPALNPFTTCWYTSGRFPLELVVGRLATFEGRVPLAQVELSWFYKGDRKPFRNGVYETLEDVERECARNRPPTLCIGNWRDQRRYHLLYFDVDLDEKTRRQCECKGKRTVCAECWFYVRVAVLVLRYVLWWQYGYRHVVALYSGKRGCHIWVLDHQSWTLTREQRAQLMERIHLVGNARTYWHTQHSEFLYQRVLLPNWRADWFGPHNNDRGRVFETLWPQLDVDVTRAKSHCIKAPFSAHLATGILVLPFRLSEDPRASIEQGEDVPYAPVHVKRVLLGEVSIEEDVQYFETLLNNAAAAAAQQLQGDSE